MVPDALIGISSSTRNKEAAMDFVFFLLRDDVQSNRGFNFPVLQKNLEAMITYWANAYMGLQVKVLNAFYEDMRIKIEGQPYSDETVERLYDLLSRTTILSKYDDALAQLILRECQTYFAGQTTAEETVKRIQSKAQIYISEQFG